MNKLQSFKAFLTYRKAVRLANKKHSEDGHRYYVLPNIDTKIFLIVTDRKNFRRIRAKGYIDQNMKMEDVFNACFYYTSQADGSGRNITQDELKVKQVKYQLWYDDRLKKIPAERKARRKELKEAKRKAKERRKEYERKQSSLRKH